MSSKIQTAKEFYLSKTGWESLDTFEEFDHPKDIVNYMIEFTKLHVEAALKEVSEQNIMIPDENQDFRFQRCDCLDYLVDKEAILNAYPLENIK